jgi:hypothetical protein
MLNFHFYFFDIQMLKVPGFYCIEDAQKLCDSNASYLLELTRLHVSVTSFREKFIHPMGLALNSLTHLAAVRSSSCRTFLRARL